MLHFIISIQNVIFLFQNYIARFGHGSAKLARQAQSKEKTLKKMVDAGLTEKVAADKVCFHINKIVSLCVMLKSGCVYVCFY